MFISDGHGPGSPVGMVKRVGGRVMVSAVFAFDDDDDDDDADDDDDDDE